MPETAARKAQDLSTPWMIKFWSYEVTRSISRVIKITLHVSFRFVPRLPGAENVVS